MKLTFEKAKSIAKKMYFTNVVRVDRNNYKMISDINSNIENLTKSEIIEMVESWEEFTKNEEFIVKEKEFYPILKN